MPTVPAKMHRIELSAFILTAWRETLSIQSDMTNALLFERGEQERRLQGVRKVGQGALQGFRLVLVIQPRYLAWGRGVAE